MITETKTIYKCEHCRKLYQVKAAAERHEAKCKRNPDYQRACFGCAFITKKPVVWEQDNGYTQWEKQLNVCFCTKKNVIVRPPNAYMIDAGSICDKETDEELLEEAMPKTCDLFKLHGMVE